MRRFDVLRVATGSCTVESKRIASRKLFKRVPDLQDVKNGSKRTKIIENRKNPIFSDFLTDFPGLFSCRFSSDYWSTPCRPSRVLIFHTSMFVMWPLRTSKHSTRRKLAVRTIFFAYMKPRKWYSHPHDLAPKYFEKNMFRRRFSYNSPNIYPQIRNSSRNLISLIPKEESCKYDIVTKYLESNIIYFTKLDSLKYQMKTKFWNFILFSFLQSTNTINGYLTLLWWSNHRKRKHHQSSLLEFIIHNDWWFWRLRWSDPQSNVK